MRLSIRYTVIILFIILFFSSLWVLNSFFLSQQREINQVIKNIQFDDSIGGLSFETAQDSANAAQMISRYRESVAAAEAIQSEAQIYSAVFLFLILIIAITLFVGTVYKLTKPLADLREATAQISEGAFVVSLPEKGFSEIRELTRSFNSMSAELARTQKKLLEAEKELIWKEMSRILAHEIKNPLTPIKLTMQRLESMYHLDKDRFLEIFPESVEMMNQEINNLYKVASSFSDFAKINTANRQIIDPLQSIKDVISSYKQNYPIELIAVQQKLLVSFDPMHFYQIITNLVQNAIDASENKTPIIIDFKMKKDYIVIDICDKGKGMDEQEITRIFEPYYSNKKRGTGLGLALVKKLCTLNKAKISVSSQPAKGSVFSIMMELQDESSGN